MHMVVTITTLIMYSLVINSSSVRAVPTVIYPNNDAPVSLPLHTSANDKITPVESKMSEEDTSGDFGDTVKTTILPSILIQMDSRVAKETTQSNSINATTIISREAGNSNDSNAINGTSEMKNQFNDEVILSSDESSLPLATQSDALAESISSVTTTIATPSESETTNTKLLFNQTGVSFVKSYVMNQTQSTDGKISSSEFTSSPPPESVRGENEISSSSSSPSQVSTSSTTFVPSSTLPPSDLPSEDRSETREDVEDKIINSSWLQPGVLTKASAQTVKPTLSTSPSGENSPSEVTTAASTSTSTSTSTAAITSTDAPATATTASPVQVATTTAAAETTTTTATSTSTKEVPVTFAVSHVNQTTREGRTDDSSESINYEDPLNIPTTLPASTVAVVHSTTNNNIGQTSVASDGLSNTSNSSSTIPVTLQPLLSETLATNSLSSSITDQSKSPPSELMTTPVAFNSTPDSPSTTTASTTTVSTAITSATTATATTTTANALDVPSETPASHVALVPTLNNNTSSPPGTSNNPTLPDAVTESTLIHGKSDVTSGNSTPLETATSPAGGTSNWTITLPPAVTPSSTSDLPLERDVKDNSLENNDLGPSSEVPRASSAAIPFDTELPPAPTTVTSDLGDPPSSSFNVSVTPHIYPELPSNDVTGDINAPSTSGNETQDVKQLGASELPPATVSKDRSSRREAHSLMSMCMNSVEIFVVSVVLIFFAASALVVCLLVGFCRRKGNTFDVQVRLFLF